MTQRPLSGRFRIRQAAVDDLVPLAQVKAQAWRESYPFSEAVFSSHDQHILQTAQRWADDVALGGYYWAVVDTAAEQADTWVGVAHACAARDDDAPAPLELAMIYLLEVAKGSGIADRLLQLAIGDAPCYLWVLAGNERAISFYTRHGFVADGARRQLTGELAGEAEIRLVRP